MAADKFFVYLPGWSLVGDDVLNGIYNLGASSVVESKSQCQTGIVLGQRYCLLYSLLQSGGYSIQPSQMTQAGISLVELAGLVIHDFFYQAEDAIDFFLGAAPVFRGEAIQGNIFDAVLVETLDSGTDSLDTGAVSGNPGQVALLCPPSVAIHDDSYMLRQVGNTLYSG